MQGAHSYEVVGLYLIEICWRNEPGASDDLEVFLTVLEAQELAREIQILNGGIRSLTSVVWVSVGHDGRHRLLSSKALLGLLSGLQRSGSD